VTSDGNDDRGSHLGQTLNIAKSPEPRSRIGNVAPVKRELRRIDFRQPPFSVIDLFILNALTIVTEFIGISLALGSFGLPKYAGVIVAAVLVMVGAAQGNFRRFERFRLVLCFGSLFLVPVLVAVHAPLGQSTYEFFVPGLPKGADLSTVMLLIAGIVGTTVAPWQLFFQQSYVIDKRITPRFINYERWDRDQTDT